MLFAETTMVLARRSGRGIGRLIGWIVYGVSRGEPAAIGVAAVAVAGIGFWAYSSFNSDD